MTKPNKSKDIGIEKPFYVPYETYELTLNPKKQYFNDPKRLQKCTKDLNKLLLDLSDVADIELQPELSEPRNSNPDKTFQSRLHYHGILTLSEHKSSAGLFMLHYLSKIKQYGDYQFNHSSEGDGHGLPNRAMYWSYYMDKQRSIMEPLYRHYKIPYIHQTIQDPAMLRLAKLEGSQSNC